MLWRNQTFCTKSQISAKAVKQVPHDGKIHDVTLNFTKRTGEDMSLVSLYPSVKPLGVQGLSNLQIIQKNKQTAFTLAELLITLVIIGVIAAITVPLLFAHYQKQATVSKLKKAYANLANAIKLSEMENGPMYDWDFNYTVEEGPEQFFKKYLSKYIVLNKYRKDYTEATSHIQVNTLDGNSLMLSHIWMNLSDGTSITMHFRPEVNEYGVRTGFVWLFVDLNASNKPNVLGKDIFMFELYRKGKLVFWGSDNKAEILINDSSAGRYSCKKGTGQQYAGGYCGELIFRNGFEIPDNYPW